MDNTEKMSFLKELEFYSRLLQKHEALKKEKELKSTIIQQSRISQQSNKPTSFQNYKVVKNQCKPVLSFNQKYSLKRPFHVSVIDHKKENAVYNQRQNFKFSSSKSTISNKVSPMNKCVVNNKNLKYNVPVVNAKSISNSKNESSKVPCMAINESEKLTCNTQDFIKEIESLTELLKKKASSSVHKTSNSELKCKNLKQGFSHKKDQGSTNMMNEISFLKTKALVKMQPKIPVNSNYVNRMHYAMNSKNNNSSQQKAFSLNKHVYKKNNIKQPLNANPATSSKNAKSLDELKGGFKKVVPRSSSSRKVIFSDLKNLASNVTTSNKTGVFKSKSSGTHNLVMKLHTPNKISPLNRRALKKSPHVFKMKSPALLKIKSNSVKVPKIVKLKQANFRYTKINKHMTPPNKKVQLECSTQQKSLKKSKEKINNKYKLINKTRKSSLNKKSTNTLCASIDKKNASLATDCDTFLEALNDSAVDKLEKNLLAISSELTAPLSIGKKEVCSNKSAQSFQVKVNSKVNCKGRSLKKSKSKISKYKIINSNIHRNFPVRSMQSEHVTTPLRRERAILVRRLFKSKNVIINKNATPTSYRAKMIKSKYLSFNKRKLSNSQKYVHPTVSQHTKFKGSFIPARLHLKQKRFKANTISKYHSKFIRKSNYGYQTYKLMYRNCGRKLKTKINNCHTHSPVVFIRGSKYARNINGKTLKKLPIKGHTTKTIQRANFIFVKRTPENLIKSFPASTNLANRVLHRSINRILTASSKKKLSKVNVYCMFYNRFGRCNRGVKCTYIHDPSKIAVCTRFLRGTCKIDGCPFSHEVDPGKMAICSFFLVGQCDKENCPYRHEKLSPNAVLCKDFVQGYCYHGKECKKAHILICPKYMQGECDKGSLCAFPHPPQKAKKNIQKEVEDEETKPTEVLLEKVLRYFQQGGDPKNELSKNSTTNLFVPKQRKLEEQPSFIPLSDSFDVMHNT